MNEEEHHLAYENRLETKDYKILRNKEVHTFITVNKIDNDDLLYYQKGDEYFKSQSRITTENRIRIEYLTQEYKKDKEVHYIRQEFEKTLDNIYKYTVKFIIDLVDWSDFSSREEYNDYHQI